MKIDTAEVELKAKDVDKIKENIFLDDYCSYGERERSRKMSELELIGTIQTMTLIGIFVVLVIRSK